MTLVIHFGHCQALDIITAPRKQTDNARQNTGFIVDQNRQSVGLDVVAKVGAEIIGTFPTGAFLDCERIHEFSPVAESAG